MASILDVKGVGPALAKPLAEGGFKTAEDLAAANLDNLLAVPGVGQPRAVSLMAAAMALVGAASDNAQAAPETPEPEKKSEKAGKAKKADKAKKKKKGDKKKTKDKKAKASKAGSKKSKKKKNKKK